MVFNAMGWIYTGMQPALVGLDSPFAYLQRMHRLQRRSEIASMHTSQNLGQDREETAANRLTRIGARTDAPK